MTTEFEKRTAEIEEATKNYDNYGLEYCDTDILNEISKELLSIRKGDLAAIRRNLPADLAVVPRVPNFNMRDAAVIADDHRTGNETCAHIYKAMIAAFEEGE